MTKLKVNREGKIKLALSFAVVIYALYVSIADKSMDAIVTMLLSCAGDINIMASSGALTGIKENSFNSGVMCFALAHFGYVSAMGKNPLCMGITMTACVLIYICINLRPSDDKLLYIPYAIAILTSAINAWLFSYIAGIGMVLFLISDIVLSIFEDKNPKWQIVIWATYIPAQVLMLTAVLLN